MAVSIRLRRMGRKKQPHYRIVVAESEHPRDGRFVESLGFYKPLSTPARLVLDLDRVDHWLGRGAQPSDTVRSLITKARRGGDDVVAVGDVQPSRRSAAPEARAERVAERGANPRRDPRGNEGLTQVPQDIAENTGGSSSEDRTAAEAMAWTASEATEALEATEPNAPRESIVRSSAEMEGDVRPKQNPIVPGATGEEDR